MDEKGWITKNCRFAQALPEQARKGRIIRKLFNLLIEDPDARYTKADVTRAMREMGLDPPKNQDIFDAVMGMPVRWYEHRDELKTKQQPSGPNVGKLGQPPVPGRGY